MKKQVNYAALSALLLVFALTGCDGTVSDGGGSFEAKLRRTWETYTPDELRVGCYNGKVVINRDTIIITGCTGYIGWPADESTRHFKGITPDVPRKGYSQNGSIYIDNFGLKEFAYVYDAGTYPNYTKLLRFNFGDRYETLQKTGE
jgi:hypothetical protein